jgi:hypothetical protein
MLCMGALRQVHTDPIELLCVASVEFVLYVHGFMSGLQVQIVT